MSAYVNLQRQFRDLTSTELENPEVLATLIDCKIGGGIDWPALLTHRRVVILAEAGAGKTREMEEQAKRLVRDGQFAFFVALESLDREPLADLLSCEEEVALESWMAEEESPAYFFLDAVDELRLTEGKLDRALRRFSKSVGANLARTHVVISCRPNDWRPSLDLAIVQEKLPVQVSNVQASRTPADEVFLSSLRNETSDPVSEGGLTDGAVAMGAFRMVILLPLSNQQIRQFSEQSGVGDAVAFLDEVGRQNAWIFARRPLDLSELIATWLSAGRLGSRAEQHEANITAKLKDSPDRAARDALADSKAREGAERLALALALTRTRTLRSPDQALDIQHAEGVLDPAGVLANWTEKERQTLLRRALFDPATYGRIRFHHRSVQEFLAARRLKVFRDKGMSTRSVFRLLFAERYGVDVVIPSMLPIAAWLALWDDDVRREIMRREPEALLLLGDPESLSVGARGQLMQAFVAAYGHGSWRGLNIPVDEVRRLAHPSLAPLVRTLWGNGPANADVRDLLIELIWQGPIVACADLVYGAAVDATWGDYQRVAAIRAVIACGQSANARRIAEDIITCPTRWPDKIVHVAAADLFPSFLSVDEVMALIERTPEQKDAGEGFQWSAREMIATMVPGAKKAVALRDAMSDLIWRGRNPTQEFYHIQGRFDYIAPALAMLCERQLTEMPSQADPALIRACVVSSRFGDSDGQRHDRLAGLRKHFADNALFRELAFWAELVFMDDLVAAEDDWHRFYNVEHGSLIGHVTSADRAWIEAAIGDVSQPHRRMVAIHAFVQCWHRRGQVDAELKAIRGSLADAPALEAALNQATLPPPYNAQRERMEQQSREHHAAQLEREENRLEGWKKWREQLLVDPAEAFSPENQGQTVRDLHSWLNLIGKKQRRFNVWDKAALVRVFGAAVADLAEETFRALWRNTTPDLWSARPAAEQNGTPHSWLRGLCGIAIEAAVPGWAFLLTPEDARTAAAYATVELNGFAPFINDLVVAQPAAVDVVIGGELSAELVVVGDQSYLPALQNLTHWEIALKRLLAPRLLVALPACPIAFTDDAGARWMHNLGQILSILDETSDDAERQAIALECERRYKAHPTGQLALAWLRGLFRFDTGRGTDVLTSSLAAQNSVATPSSAIRIFAGLFGDRGSILFEIANPDKRARALGQLVRCAYAFIRHEDDRIRVGVYTPTTRDHAERARDFLLSALLDTPGMEAQRIILALAGEKDFAHFPDRLRLRARQRAAMDAEFAPYDLGALTALDSRYEAPPHDRDGLFAVMMDRLEDLAHDVAHHDFTNRRTLRSIKEEVEMQRTLALHLGAHANGAYVVTREDEVADLKRTDLRFLAVRGEQKAVAEVKIADKWWSLSELERALRDQLVGQYLRHAACKAGCLLLTYDGEKKYWQHPHSGKRMKFLEMVAYLNQKAFTLETERGQEIRLAVFGLDLTDPALASAHR